MGVVPVWVARVEVQMRLLYMVVWWCDVVWWGVVG